MKNFKYNDIFKSFWFWLFVAFNFLLELNNYVNLYKTVFIGELIGILIASFLIVTFIASCGYGVLTFYERFIKKT